MRTCRRPVSYDFDDSYLNRLKNDDIETGRHFADYFTGFLGWRLAARYRDVDLVEDIRQETLRRVVETVRRGRVRDSRRFEAFVNSVCTRVLLEYWRTVKKHAHTEIDLDALIASTTPERLYHGKEAVHRVRIAMNGLPLRDRQILSIVFVEDHDAHELSRRLHVSQTYARVLVHRALGRLRALC